MSLPFVIENCFDSHVHWLPTGELASQLRIDEFGSISDWKQVLSVQPPRGNWKLLFGWNPDQFPNMRNVSSRDLDQVSLDMLIVSHRDGHSGILNSAGLAALGWKSRNDVPESLRAFVQVDSQGALTGQIREQAHFHVLEALPKVETHVRAQYLLKAQDLFLSSGFTHIREMMADTALLADLAQLEVSRSLKLYSEMNLHAKDLSSLPQIFAAVGEFRKTRAKRVRISGVKVFLDGALGSEGAALSFPYASHQHDVEHFGAKLWQRADLMTLLTEVWNQGLRVSAHAIGDAALTELLEVAQELRKKGIEGGLSIEHAEVIAPAAFPLMRELSLDFHFQPSHFLSDQKWLKQKLGEKFVWAFPWHKIEKLGFPIFFGSDTPIEKPSLALTLKGLRESAAAGIPACQLDWKFAHSYPEKWGKGCQTWVNEDAEVLRVLVDGELVYQRPVPQ